MIVKDNFEYEIRKYMEYKLRNDVIMRFLYTNDILNTYNPLVMVIKERIKAVLNVY